MRDEPESPALPAIQLLTNIDQMYTLSLVHQLVYQIMCIALKIAQVLNLRTRPFENLKWAFQI